ncbi:hypothetical protein Tco_0633971 [Tanacetum coccineum]
MGGSSSQPQNTGYWQEPNTQESPVEEVATSPTKNKKKATRNRQKRTSQSVDAPRRLCGQQRKKLRCVKVGLPFLKTARMESGAGDEDYVQRAMIHYEIDTGVAFKLRHCWEILKDRPKWQEIALPNFSTGSGGSKRHKSSGSSSGQGQSESCCEEKERVKSGSTSNVNEDALAKLMVTEMIAQEKEERLAFLDIKRMEVECRERELEQQDMRFYLQPYDHLTGD